MSDPKSNRLKGLYIGILLLAAIGSIATFVVFQSQPKMYRAVGRFTYYYPSKQDAGTSYIPFTSETFTKSIAESAKTREFLESLFISSGDVSYDPSILEHPAKVIQAKVVSGSNVIDVSVVMNDLKALKTISDNYFNVLKNTPLIKTDGPSPVIQILDPMFIEGNPYYPRPLHYAALTFASIILVGMMIIYVFASTEN